MHDYNFKMRELSIVYSKERPFYVCKTEEYCHKNKHFYRIAAHNFETILVIFYESKEMSI